MEWDLDISVADIEVSKHHFRVTRPVYHPLVYSDGRVDCSGLSREESINLHKMSVDKQLTFISDYLQHPLRYANNTTFINP